MIVVWTYVIVNLCAGTQTQPKPSLGLKSMWLGLEPSQNLAWDANPCGWGSNPAKTHSTWFQDLMKLRFLMSHYRKNSVRNKVIGKKWIYSDSGRSTLHRVWDIAQGQWVRLRNVAWLVFIGWVISYANEWEDYSIYFGEEVEISTGHCSDAQFLAVAQFLGLLTVPWNCQRCLWVCHFTCWLRIRV